MSLMSSRCWIHSTTFWNLWFVATSLWPTATSLQLQELGLVATSLSRIHKRHETFHWLQILKCCAMNPTSRNVVEVNLDVGGIWWVCHCFAWLLTSLFWLWFSILLRKRYCDLDIEICNFGIYMFLASGQTSKLDFSTGDRGFRVNTCYGS